MDVNLEALRALVIYERSLQSGSGPAPLAFAWLGIILEESSGEMEKRTKPVFFTFEL